MESTKEKIQTLHAHTTNSDGVLTPEQLLEECSKNGIGVVAFTDHDTLPTEAQVKSLSRFKDLPTKYVYGIELTSDYPKELVGSDPHMFHIVGLFVDPFNKDLFAHTLENKERRRKKINLRVKEFNRLGFTLTSNEIFAQVTKEGIPTSLNLVLSLLKHDQNATVLKKFFQKLVGLSKTNTEAKKIRDDILADDGTEKQKYFGMFFKDGSPFKIELPKEKLADLDTTVNLIRRAGGLSVLAHWSYDSDNLTKDTLEKIVKEKRVDGLETVYDLFLLQKPLWKKRLQKDRPILRALAKQYGLFTSGGVDAHKKEDFKLFADTKAYSKETVGMVQKIIASTNCDVKNSSLVRDVDY